MNYEEAIKFWINSSLEDFATAKAMRSAKRYNYTMFMCQQVLEELLKAIIVLQTHDHPPFLHDLILLSKKINLKIPSHILENLRDINPHYIIARYKPQRFNPAIYNLTAARKAIKITQEAIQWFTEKMALKKYLRNS
jgi:HEPN domain-containing protein